MTTTLEETKKEEEKVSEEWLKEDSQELKVYFNSLKTKAGLSNPKSMCGFCWCLLSSYQKERHIEAHTSGLKTPSLYSSSLESFKDLALSYGHSRELNGKLEFRRLKEEPEKKTQTKVINQKKMKMNSQESEEKKQEPQIPIKLTKKNFYEHEPSQSASSTSQNEWPQQNKEKQVSYILLFDIYDSFLGEKVYKVV